MPGIFLRPYMPAVELADVNACSASTVECAYKFIHYTAHQYAVYWHVSPSAYCGWHTVTFTCREKHGNQTTGFERAQRLAGQEP